MDMYRTFILSNFNYCPVVWMLCGKGNKENGSNSAESPAICFFYDFTSSYDELLKRSRQPSISIHYPFL